MKKALVLALLSVCAASSWSQAKGPGRRALSIMRKGVAAYQEARFDEALELLSKALELDPGWRTASGYRAMVLWTTGDVKGAHRDAGLAARMRPDSAESYAARGLARFVLKDMESAASDFVRAAKLDPKCALAYFGMGSVRSSQKQLDEALVNLNIAVRLAPKAAVAYVVRGTVQDKKGLYAKAAADYTRVLRIAPDFVWAYYYRGRARRELKDYGKAAEDLTNFLARYPDYEDALYYRSNAYFLTGAYGKAVDDLDHLLDLNPAHGLAYANRGIARGQMGDREGALSDLRKAKSLAPAEKAESIQSQIDRLVREESLPEAGGAGHPAEDGAAGGPTGIAAQPTLPGGVPLEPEEGSAIDRSYTQRSAEQEKKREPVRRETPPARLPIDESPDRGDFLFVR